MEELARKVLPPGISFGWTGLAFQQQLPGTPTILVFGAAALFVFLVLAAQYENLKLPLAASSSQRMTDGLERTTMLQRQGGDYCRVLGVGLSSRSDL
jgi:hypothetical protein